VLEEQGHDVVAISRSAGVDLVTGDGLADALHGVESVVDASGGASPEEQTATDFFTAATRNLQQLGARASVRRIIVVSIIRPSCLRPIATGCNHWAPQRLHPQLPRLATEFGEALVARPALQARYRNVSAGSADSSVLCAGRMLRRPTARSPAEWRGFVVSAIFLYRKRTTRSR
jgi:hypothetical protein